MAVLVRLLLALILILGGLQAGTQWSASLLSRQEKGPAWHMVMGHPIYRPYQGVWWFLHADEDRTLTLLPPLGLTAGCGLLGMALLRAGRRTSRARVGDRYVSGTRWATRADLKRGGLL